MSLEGVASFLAQEPNRYIVVIPCLLQNSLSFSTVLSLIPMFTSSINMYEHYQRKPPGRLVFSGERY